MFINLFDNIVVPIKGTTRSTMFSAGCWKIIRLQGTLSKIMLIVMEYTKFEKARIVGARALQLAFGAPPLIKVPTGVSSPLDLAELEFNDDAIPIVVVRPHAK